MKVGIANEITKLTENMGFGHQESAFFEIAQAAVNQFGRAAGGTPCKILLLDEQNA